ncbi:MAG: DNA oxidative demethylase AlkB [Proteobacteria bacterium]|nr:DNA oxidative demethylase AlkB [Pseudomonadota bacterium]
MTKQPVDDLFADDPGAPDAFALGAQALLLRGLALAQAQELLRCVARVVHDAPWRHMATPGGQSMSVAMTGCGPLCWVSDRQGYRYAERDPLTGRPWPAMPEVFARLARDAAQRAGFADFTPDACLINRYAPGARMSLHQDRDERDLAAPIVSVSLGLPAVFLWGGATRSERAQRVPLGHGDVVVWGGVDRLRYHGVLPVAPGQHPATGDSRINLTLRRAR